MLSSTATNPVPFPSKNLPKIDVYNFRYKITVRILMKLFFFTQVQKLVHKTHILYSIKCSCYIYALSCVHLSELRIILKISVWMLRTSFLWSLTHKQTTLFLCSSVGWGKKSVENYIFSTGISIHVLSAFWNLFTTSIISRKISETNSSFRVKYRTTGNVLLLFFGTFLLVLTTFLFWQAEWALGYHFLKLRHFPNISKSP